MSAIFQGLALILGGLITLVMGHFGVTDHVFFWVCGIFTGYFGALAK